MAKKEPSLKVIYENLSFDQAEVQPIKVDGFRHKMQIEDLSLSFGSKLVLRNVSMGIKQGSITAIVGPSGSGKSSLLAAMNRLTDFYNDCQVTGKIELSGQDILKVRDVASIRKRVGLVFQKPNPFPVSIKKNILIPLKEHFNLSKLELEEKIENILVMVGLWDEVKDRLDKSALSLSGGQQQRLCIARALSLTPEIILFDEPTSALDPLSGEKIENLILNLKKSTTIVLVTHQLGQARRIADSVGIIWPINGAGELIEFKDTTSIFESPSHIFTKAYLMNEKFHR